MAGKTLGDLRRLLTVTGFAIVAGWSFIADAAGPVYPQNPALSEDAVYVASSGGISRHQRVGLQRSWRALTDLQVFEPVVTETGLLVGSSSGLYALDPNTGKIRWRVAPGQTVFSPVVYKAVAYAGDREGVVRALDIATGDVLWSRQYQGWIYPPAIVGDTLIFGGSGGQLYAVHPRSGASAWSVALSQELVYRPIPAPEGRVVVTTFAGEVRALSAATGETVWSVAEPTAVFSPSVAGDYLYTGTFDGTVRVRRLSNGQVVRSWSLHERLPFIPQVYGDLVLVGSDQGRIAAFSSKSGEIVWQHDYRKMLAANPVMIDQSIVVVSEEGQLSSLGVDLFTSSFTY